MLQSIFISAIVKAILQWIKSLVDSWIEKQKNIEQGRQEVLDKLKQNDKEADEALRKIGNSSLTDDELARELRDGYDKLRSNKKRMSGD